MNRNLNLDLKITRLNYQEKRIQLQFKVSRGGQPIEEISFYWKGERHHKQPSLPTYSHSLLDGIRSFGESSFLIKKLILNGEPKGLQKFSIEIPSPFRHHCQYPSAPFSKTSFSVHPHPYWLSDRLKDMFEQAMAQKPRVLWISGPPGVGKTFLVRHLKELKESLDSKKFLPRNLEVIPIHTRCTRQTFVKKIVTTLVEKGAVSKDILPGLRFDPAYQCIQNLLHTLAKALPDFLIVIDNPPTAGHPLCFEIIRSLLDVSDPSSNLQLIVTSWFPFEEQMQRLRSKKEREYLKNLIGRNEIQDLEIPLWTRDEIGSFVEYYTNISLTNDAKNQVYYFTGGNPYLVNLYLDAESEQSDSIFQFTGTIRNQFSQNAGSELNMEKLYNRYNKYLTSDEKEKFKKALNNILAAPGFFAKTGLCSSDEDRLMKKGLLLKRDDVSTFRIPGAWRYWKVE